MPALPVSEAFAFRAPVVNGGKLVLPILVDGTPAHTHGFRASITLWREAAQGILRATAPDCGERERRIRPSPIRGVIPVFLVIVLTLLGGGLAALGFKHYSEAKAPAKLEAKQQAVTDAQTPVLKGVQENLHKAQLSIAQVPDSRAKQITAGFIGNGVTEIDQVVGPADQANTVLWEDLVDRLMSENDSVRAKADADNAAAEGRIAAVSTKLETVTADRDTYQQKFNEQAAAAIAAQAKLHKYEWIIGGILVLWLLGTILAKLAQANPIFEGVSGFVNSFVAPGVHAALNDAKQTIDGVGKAIAVAKTTLAPEIANSLAAGIAAAVPNQKHVKAMAAAATTVAQATPGK